MPSAHDTQAWVQNFRDERDNVELYTGLANIERDEGRRQKLMELAQAEQRHAAIWEQKLCEAGVRLAPARPSVRVRLLLLLARVSSPRAVLPIMARAEEAEILKYIAAGDEHSVLVQEERDHLGVIEELRRKPGEDRRSGAGHTGSIRAAVFGMNDGLVSNLALVLGVAAAGVSAQALIITGLAGLLAGAFSMGVGEYVSVASQRDLLRRKVRREMLELKEMPAEEERELVLLFERKGISPTLSRQIAAEIIQRPDKALDALVEEAFGFEPSEVGSPWSAARSSFASFCLGALIPLLPFIIWDGTTAIVASALASGMVLATVAIILALLSATSVLKSVLRMVGLAAVATAATVALGQLIGGNLAG